MLGYFYKPLKKKSNFFFFSKKKKRVHSAPWEEVTIFILKLFMIFKIFSAFWINGILQER